MKYKIPISKPSLSKEDLNELIRCFNSSWISSRSPWVGKFEKLFAQKISKTKYAVAVNSGTSALFLALKALGITKEDEVILPTFTMIATANAVEMAGAKPVLVDCQSLKNWNIDAKDIEKKITKKTKAIIVVHIYGYPCPMGEILNLARKHNLFVIEDAAEAMGTIYRGKHIGSFGHFSCFSLYSNKVITAGNGGVVCTNSKKLANLVRQLSFFDFNPKTHFTHRVVGYNMVLSGLQAALALSQTKRFNKLLSKKRKIYSLYEKYLKGEKKIHFLKPAKEAKPNFWFPAIIFSSQKDKLKAVSALEKERIETRIFFRPIHLQPVYKKMFQGLQFPISNYFYDRGLLLPSFYQLQDTNVRQISEIIRGSLK